MAIRYWSLLRRFHSWRRRLVAIATTIPGTYRIRYKQILGQELVDLLATKPGRNLTACWNFQFEDAKGTVTQNPIDYCR
jgi:hypothetical protein